MMQVPLPIIKKILISFVIFISFVIILNESVNIIEECSNISDDDNLSQCHRRHQPAKKEENDIIFRLPIGDLNTDFKIYKGDEPCEKIKKFCNEEYHEDPILCINRISTELQKFVFQYWTNIQESIILTEPFFCNCNIKCFGNAAIPSISNKDIEVSKSKSDKLIHLLKMALESRDPKSKYLKKYNSDRISLLQTPHDRFYHYKEAIPLVPNNLFAVDQLGLAMKALNMEKEAELLFDNFVKLGYWGNTMQRPMSKYVDSLSKFARPWHKSEEYDFLSLLEKGTKAIRDELFAKSLDTRYRNSLLAVQSEGIHEGGEWEELVLMKHGEIRKNAANIFPRTLRIIKKVKQKTDVNIFNAKFSILQPGTHVTPHCGPSNSRLRIHLALLHTGGAYMRVGNETRQFEVGKTFIFDDSYEHEVFHNGTDPRVVLLMDIWHPMLPVEQRGTIQMTLKLGSLVLKSNIILAPLEGVSCVGFRNLCSNLGAGLTWTEMVRGSGIRKGNKATLDLIDTFDESTTTGIQLMVKNEIELQGALDKIEELSNTSKPHFRNIKAIDLNFGCPSPEIIKIGAGPALMKRTTKISCILETLENFKTSTSLEISAIGCKIRLGLNAQEVEKKIYLNIVEIAHEKNLDYIVVHGRHAKQKSYGELADWHKISEIVKFSNELSKSSNKKEKSPKIIGNGDCFTRKDYENKLHNGVDGIMVARAAMNNPWSIRSMIEPNTSNDNENDLKTVDFPSHKEIRRAIEKYKHISERYHTKKKFSDFHLDNFKRLEKCLLEPNLTNISLSRFKKLKGKKSLNFM